MKSDEGRFRYYKKGNNGELLKAVAIPYKKLVGKAPYELLLVDAKWPIADSLIRDILEYSRIGKCKITFPEFLIHNKHDMIPIMKEMGLHTIFNPEKETFKGIAAKPLYIKMYE